MTFIFNGAPIKILMLEFTNANMHFISSTVQCSVSIVQFHLKHHKIFRVQWKMNTSNDFLLVLFSLVRSYVFEYVFLTNLTATCHQKWNGTRNVNLKSDLVFCSSTMQQEYAIIFALNTHIIIALHQTFYMWYAVTVYCHSSWRYAHPFWYFSFIFIKCSCIFFLSFEIDWFVFTFFRTHKM